MRLARTAAAIASVLAPAVLALTVLPSFAQAARLQVVSSAPMRIAQAPHPVLPASDAQAVRATVEAQLAAMAADDSERAFGYASPALRRQFGDAQRFMALVRQAYPMVIRPAAAVFFVPLVDGAGVLQQVQLRDADGQLWLASYRLARQPDGIWRIEGCSVVADTARRST
ncbi:MAG: DUF4864 domain-containing protein [Rubrivivax sp.]